MTKGYMIYTLCTVHTRDDRLRCTLTDVGYCCYFLLLWSNTLVAQRRSS